MPSSYCFAALAALAVLSSVSASADPTPPPSVSSPALPLETSVSGGIKVTTNLCYTSDNDQARSLDMYQPEKAYPGRPPLAVLIHGGGWAAGEKSAFGGLCREFVRRGYIAASLNYRLTHIEGLPVPILDCKSAIRWLRAHADQYGFDPNRIIVGGHSAGGHLSEFLAASNGVKKFDQGENLNESSDVQGAYCMAGISDLTAWGFHGLALDKCADVSPVTWISKKSAPMYIVHGEVDNLVPVAQAVELHDALDKAGVPNQLHIIPGEGHGSAKFTTLERLNEFDAFIGANTKIGGKSAMTVPAVGAGAYKIVNVSAPDLVLDAAGSASADGTPVNIDTPSGKPNQRWIFVSKGNGLYAVHPTYDAKVVLTVNADGDANQTKIVLAKDEGKPGQLWTVLHYPMNDMYFLIPKCAPGSALENFGGRTQPGSQVDLWQYNGDDPHMQWHLSSW